MTPSLVFIIRHPDGQREQLSVDSDRVLVGSGAHCEVRLLPEHAALEHLLVEARQGLVFGAARSFHPPPMVNGTPFTQGRLLPESSVKIGATELSISLLRVASSASAGQKRKTGPRLRTYLLALLASALSLYVITNSKRASSAMSMPEVAPELFVAEEVACPERAPDPALALGRELRLSADGKRERWPFRPHDGVAAVPLYARAGACFAIAEQPSLAQEAKRDAALLQSKLEDEFKLTRLRLEHALGIQDWPAARRHIHLLQSYLEGRSGDYSNWLSNVDRRITIKFSSTKGTNK